MNVLVIGGTRYFGKLIVDELLTAGHSVTVFTRGNRRPAFLNQVTHLTGDRSDRQTFRETFRLASFDAVIDNIGYRPEEVSVALETFRGRVGLYIFTSTSAVYLDKYLYTDLLREEDYDPTRRSECFDPQMYQYAISKIESEEQVRQATDLAHVILRAPIVAGPDDHALRVYFFIQRILDGGPVLMPELEQFSVRHIFSRDLARIYAHVLKQSDCWNQTYNVAGKDLLTSEEYIGFMANHIGMELRLAYVPDDQLENIGYHQPLEFSIPLSIARFEEKVKCEMTPFAAWMRDTIDWYMKEYSGPDSKNYDSRQREIELANWYS